MTDGCDYETGALEEIRKLQNGETADIGVGIVFALLEVSRAIWETST